MALEIRVDLNDEQLKQIAKHIVASGLLPELLEKNEKPLDEQFMTIKQVASFTDQSTQTIINHIKSGILKANRMGKSWRVSRQSLKDYVNGE